MIKLKVRRIGNSAGVTLPKEALALLRVKEGDTLVLTEAPGGMKITAQDAGFETDMEAFEEGRGRYRNALRELAK